MTSTLAKAKGQDKPWRQYNREAQHRLLEPGWGDSLDEDEVTYILDRLKADDSLSYSWGFRPRAKRRAISAVERVAMHGDPEIRSVNVRLVREAGKRVKAEAESAPARVKQSVVPAQARPGRKRIESWEGELLRLSASGMGVKRIAKALQAQGVAISHTTVANWLRELKGQLRLIS
jgi:hypothetical protein